MKKVTISGVVGIALFILSAFLFGQVIAVQAASTPRPFHQDLLEVTVYRLMVDPTSMQPVLLLADPSQELAIPIWIGPNEALAIQGELDGIKPPRPLTHDLLERVIRQFKGTVKRVIITHEKEGIYHAIIVLEKDQTLLEIDGRPSDSIAMALKFQAPIFIARDLFKERAVLLEERQNAEEAYGLTIQELTPELADLFSYKRGKGVLIADVRQGSQAEKDGIQTGDILFEIGGEEIDALQEMRRALRATKGPTKIKIFRKGSISTPTLHPPPR